MSLTAAIVTTDKVSAHWVATLTSQTTLKAAGLRPDDQVAMSYRGMKWRVWVSQAFQVPSGLVPFNRYTRANPDPKITLIVVPWNPRLPAATSWPAARSGWRPVALVSSGVGSWAAWREVGATRSAQAVRRP